MTQREKEIRKEIVQAMVGFQLSNPKVFDSNADYGKVIKKEEAKILVENAKTILEVLIEKDLI